MFAQQTLMNQVRSVKGATCVKMVWIFYRKIPKLLVGKVSAKKDNQDQTAVKVGKNIFYL